MLSKFENYMLYVIQKADIRDKLRLQNVSSPAAYSSIMLEKDKGRRAFGSHDEHGEKENRSQLYSDKLLTDKVEPSAPFHARDQYDESQSESRKAVTKRLGTIGGTNSRRHNTAPHTVATGETAKETYGPSNTSTSMQIIDLNNSENLTKTGIAQPSPRNGTERSKNGTANAIESKVHKRIGGISKPHSPHVINDTPLDLIENHASRGEKINRQRNNSQDMQRPEHILVTPSLSPEEKADQNREKLKQEVKGQHSVPMKKRRKF